MHNKEMVRNTTYFNHTRSTVDKVSTFFTDCKFDCPLKHCSSGRLFIFVKKTKNI